MSEKNLNIRNQFANKIINKIEKLNNDIKLLAKVDKKLSNGNNQIGGSPSITEQLIEIQLAAARAKATIENNKGKITQITTTNAKNAEANKTLIEVNSALLNIQESISGLSATLSELAKVQALPTLESLDSELSKKFKEIVGDQPFFKTMETASDGARQVDKIKSEYTRLKEYYYDLGIINPLKQEFMVFRARYNTPSGQILINTYPLAATYYSNKTKYNDHFPTSVIYSELYKNINIYRFLVEPLLDVFRAERRTNTANLTRYNATIASLKTNYESQIDIYVANRKLTEEAAIASGTTPGNAKITGEAIPIPELPVFSIVKYLDAELATKKQNYKILIHSYYDEKIAYDTQKPSYDLQKAAYDAEQVSISIAQSAAAAAATTANADADAAAATQATQDTTAQTLVDAQQAVDADAAAAAAGGTPPDPSLAAALVAANTAYQAAILANTTAQATAAASAATAASTAAAVPAAMLVEPTLSIPIKPPIPTLIAFGPEAIALARAQYNIQIDNVPGSLTNGRNYGNIMAEYNIALAAYNEIMEKYQKELAIYNSEMEINTINGGDIVLAEPKIPTAIKPTLSIPLLNEAQFGPFHSIPLNDILTLGRNAVPYASLSQSLKDIFSLDAYKYMFPSNLEEYIFQYAYILFQDAYNSYLSDKDTPYNQDDREAAEAAGFVALDDEDMEQLTNVTNKYNFTSTIFTTNNDYEEFLVNMNLFMLNDINLISTIIHPDQLTISL
jgi:hypothetical protein